MRAQDNICILLVMTEGYSICKTLIEKLSQIISTLQTRMHSVIVNHEFPQVWKLIFDCMYLINKGQ